MLALVLGGRIYRAVLLTLVAIAVLPLLGTWSSYVVRTGSMEPSINPGDVVVGSPFGHAETVPVGRVMIFRAPPGSGAGPVLRVHRVVESLGHGTFTTAGDANPTPDAAAVPRANFRSRAMLRVPYVGLPLVWLHQRRYVLLLAWVLGTALLLLLAARRIEGDRPAEDRWWSPRGRRARQAAVVAGAIGLVVAGTSSADAAFSATTATRPNTWRAATVLQQPYTAAVMTDSPYAFHRLDETSGATAADSSGNSRTGAFTSVASYHQTGALPHNTGYAVGLAAGSGRMVSGGTGLTDPTTFSVELWFRTGTTAGGKLIGFENSRNATSTAYDREAFLRTDGRVVYMGATSTLFDLVSPTALNDGAWHHLVITSTASGLVESSAMYVDGTLADSGSTLKASSSYLGWWRVGFGKVPAGTGFPSTGNLTGSVDDVAIYTTQLSTARVAAHYAAR
jgi:signal peptidase I